MNNIVLIGMPGAGKTSTAKAMTALYGYHWLDMDQVIEHHAGKSLQSILMEDGVDCLMETEERCLLSVPLANETIVATGGSAIYAEQGMARLRQFGHVVYLQVSLQTVKKRVNNWQNRGFVSFSGQNLDDVYFQRLPLYERYADITLVADIDTPEQLAQQIFALVNPA